jgi:hypothetical protein
MCYETKWKHDYCLKMQVLIFRVIKKKAGPIDPALLKVNYNATLLPLYSIQQRLAIDLI